MDLFARYQAGFSIVLWVYTTTGLLFGVLYGAAQHTRHSRAFFSWAFLWRLVIFEGVLGLFYSALGIVVGATQEYSWSSLIFLALFGSFVAALFHFLAFALAHNQARAALR